MRMGFRSCWVAFAPLTGLAFTFSWAGASEGATAMAAANIAARDPRPKAVVTCPFEEISLPERKHLGKKNRLLAVIIVKSPWLAVFGIISPTCAARGVFLQVPRRRYRLTSWRAGHGR